jgi:hypothetical protein
VRVAPRRKSGEDREIGSFSEKDIFASASGERPFEIKGNYIHLYNFENNYYKIDFNGNLFLEWKRIIIPPPHMICTSKSV